MTAAYSHRLKSAASTKQTRKSWSGVQYPLFLLRTVCVAPCSTLSTPMTAFLCAGPMASINRQLKLGLLAKSPVVMNQRTGEIETLTE